MSKMRCKRCTNLNYDYLTDRYEPDLPPFCGLHGRVRVDPNGQQQDLNHLGGCGFIEKTNKYNFHNEYRTN